VIRFTLRLVLGSGKWLAPFLMLGLWVGVVVLGPGTRLDNSTAIFPGVLVWSVWMTIIAGNVDDRHHRDILAAAAGSAKGLQVARSVSVGVLGVLVVATTVPLVALASSAPPRSKTIEYTLISSAIQIAALGLGIAVAAWLHDPILRNRAVSALLAIAAVAGILLAGPIQAAVREASRGRVSPPSYLAAASLTAMIVSVFASARAAESLSR